MTFFGPVGGPWMTISCQTMNLILTVSQRFLCFFVFLTLEHYTTHTHTTRIPVFLTGFQCFSTHTHVHTHAPATDRYLARGLSKSVCFNTRQRRAQRQGKSWWSSDTDGQLVRCTWRKKRNTDGTISQLVPSEVSLIFRKKRIIYGFGNVIFWTHPRASNRQNPVVTSGEPLEQAITQLRPILVSRKLAMRHEPNIVLRCCSR